MGFWSTELYRRLLRLSNLIIDTDKDWGGRIIKNLGAPVDPNDVLRKAELDNHRSLIPIDHPDNSVTAEKIDPQALVNEYSATGNTTDYLHPTVNTLLIPWTGKVVYPDDSEVTVISRSVSCKKAYYVAFGMIYFKSNESGYSTTCSVRVYVDGTKVAESPQIDAPDDEYSLTWLFYRGSLDEGDHTVEIRVYSYGAQARVNVFAKLEVFKLG